MQLGPGQRQSGIINKPSGLVNLNRRRGISLVRVRIARDHAEDRERSLIFSGEMAGKGPNGRIRNIEAGTMKGESEPDEHGTESSTGTGGLPP